jgi:Fe-S-cluster containining protein
MSTAPDPLKAARESLDGSDDPQRVVQAVMRFHRKVDEMLSESHRVHAVPVACSRGCSYCCHMQVEMLPPEAFSLAAWLRKHRTPAQLAAVTQRLQDNAAATAKLGMEGRKRANLPCALLGDDGACTAYEARPAQCRRFHSMDLASCKASFADPADDAIMSPAHPLVAHNAQVVVTLAQHGLRDKGLDATPLDMNVALLAALEDARSWRRWRDGKKAFVAAVARALVLLPAMVAAAVGFDLGLD